MKAGLLLLAASLAVGWPLFAKDYLIVSANVGVTLPDDWELLKKTDSFFAAGTTKQKKFVWISLHAASPSQKPPDYNSVHGANKNAADFMKQNGGNLLTVESEKPSTLAGLPCFETRSHTQLPTGQVIFSRNYILLDNVKIYSFCIESWKNDDEAMMDKIADSFHFLPATNATRAPSGAR